MRHRSSFLLLALALVAGGCWRAGEDQALSEMELRRDSGIVHVLRDGERINVGDVLALEVGDVIETLEDSSARLRLEGDRIGEMLSDGRTRVLGPRSIENQAGHLLARAGSPMEVRFDEVSVSGSGTLFRVDRGVATTRTAVYKGSATVVNPGEPRLSLPRLYEATVTANDLPAAPEPYGLQLDDPWDLVFLRDIVSLEEELDRLANGLKAQLGRNRPPLAYFRDLAPRKDVGVMKPYLEQPVEDLMVGFTLAFNADGSFASSFRRAFSLFQEGGSWGVTAGIMEIRPRVILADLERIIVATGIVDDRGGGPAAFVVAAGGVTSSGRAEPPSDGGDPEPPGDDGGGGGDTPSPQPSCGSDDLECRVEEVGLPTPMPEPTEPPTTGEGGKPKPASTQRSTSGSNPSEDDELLDVIGSILDFSR